MLMQAWGRVRRPYVEANGLDHDDGIDGVTTEKSSVLRRKGQLLGGMPLFASAQMQKDKNQASFQVGPACVNIASPLTQGSSQAVVAVSVRNSASSVCRAVRAGACMRPGLTQNLRGRGRWRRARTMACAR